MQAIANLRLLEVAQVGVQARQPDRRVGLAVEFAVQLQFPIDVGFAHQFENLPL
ncbi:hypothetical protein D3C81_2250590 [compost metagenome]